MWLQCLLYSRGSSLSSSKQRLFYYRRGRSHCQCSAHTQAFSFAEVLAFFTRRRKRSVVFNLSIALPTTCEHEDNKRFFISISSLKSSHNRIIIFPLSSLSSLSIKAYVAVREAKTDVDVRWDECKENDGYGCSFVCLNLDLSWPHI